MLIRYRPAMNDDHARERLVQLAAERGEDYAGLSRLIDRPAGYLARYARRGLPRRLLDREARLLAGYLGVEPAELSVALRDS